MKNKKLLSIVLITLMLLCILVPIALMVLWSVTKRWEWPALLPTSYSMRGILHLFEPHNKVLKVWLDSIGLSLTVTVFTLLITLPAVKALTFYPIKLKGLWQVLIWAPLIVPATSIGMGVHRQMISLGLANTWIGVVLVQLILTIPYGMLMLQDIYELIGDKLELQASMLGATKWQCFRFVTLPLLVPGVIAAGIFIFTVSFGQYFLTFLIGGGKVMTLPMLMFPFVQQGDRVLSAVYSILFIGTLLVILHLFEKLMKKCYGGRE